MMKEIDCRGLACPAPVLQTKEALETEPLTKIKVTVDNEAAKQNVKRFLESQQFQVSIEIEDSLFHVIGTRTEQNAQAQPELPVSQAHSEKLKILVVIATDRLGHGDEELGKRLILNFLGTLKEMGEDLWRLVFLNSGVKLTVEGSGALKTLKELADRGVDILVCGTCLSHFNLLDKKQIGETTNMLDIVTSMQLADKVINI